MIRNICQNLSRQCKEIRISEAIEAYNKAIEINKENAAAWYYKGRALSYLGRYEEATRALRESITIVPNALSLTAIGEICFELGDLEGATKNIRAALKIEKNNSWALTLQGKIEIEEKQYQAASLSFEKAISCGDCMIQSFQLSQNVQLLLLDSYANFLWAEFFYDPKSNRYQEEIASIIRSLEKAYELSVRCNNRPMEKDRAYILYFLANFYLKAQDVFKAKEKLIDCITLDSPVKSSAKEMLDYVWNHQIRPPFWRWWLSSPLHKWPKRIVFFLVLLHIGGLIMGPQFNPEFIEFLRQLPLINQIKPELIQLFYPFIMTDQPIYYLYIVLLIAFILLPILRRIKAKDIEVELLTPLPFNQCFSPTAMLAVANSSHPGQAFSNNETNDGSQSQGGSNTTN